MTPHVSSRRARLWDGGTAAGVGPLVLVTLLFIGQTSQAAPATDHSIFTWDYSEELGSVTWWPLWYPSCELPYQSPIDINDTAVTIVSGETIVLHTSDKGPMRYVDAVVAYNSSYNIVVCDVSVAKERFNIYWAKDAAVPDKPLFQLKQITFRFPSEHTHNGKFFAGELRYTFVSTETWPVDEATVIDDVIDESTIVALSVLLHEVNGDSGDTKVEALLNQVMKGYDSGTGHVLPYIPDVGRAFNYKGTQTTPPCRGNVQYIVGEKTFAIESSTLEKFKFYGPNWETYRTVRLLDGRPLRLVGYLPQGLEPDFRQSPAPAAYELVRGTTHLVGVLLQYAAVTAGSVCGVLLICLLKLGFDRYTFSMPYVKTFHTPVEHREVFGCPVRYGVETGVPKPRRSWDAFEEPTRTVANLSNASGSSIISGGAPRHGSRRGNL